MVRECSLKYLFFIFIFLLAGQAFALENINFDIKEPYPVCIQEAKKLEPNLPESFFDLKKENPKSQDLSTPCNDFLCNEAKRNGFNGLTNFFQKDFPKVEQELFAQELIKSGNYAERLKTLNDTLINCQERTENLHKLAAEAAGDIYDFTSSDPTKFVPAGYKVVDPKTDFFEFPDSDIKGYLLMPSKDDIASPASDGVVRPPIIAFAGTRSIKSAVADLNYGAVQVNNVKVKFQQWLNQLKLQNQKELVITGHSLGGGLAQTLSAMMPEPSEIQTHVVTFNGFGGKDAIKAYNTLYGGIDKNKNYDKFQPTRDAVGYRMEGDIVSLLGERFGETRTIPTVISLANPIANHKMPNLQLRIDSSPHALSDAKREDVSTFVRPISFIVQAATYVKAGWDKLTNSMSEVFEKECTGIYYPNGKQSNICESSNGDADLCLKEGLELKQDDSKLIAAMEKFKIGCELCESHSCKEYAVLNKIVGYESKTLKIAKRACDLADAESCIEAGTIIAKDLAASEKSDDKFIRKGCESGSAELCKHVPNQEFAIFMGHASMNICSDSKNINSCELMYLSSDQCTLPYDARKKRIYELLNKQTTEINPKGSTPLHIALESGHSDVAKILMTNGAILSNKERDESFLKATKAGHLEVVKLLIERGAKPQGVNEQVGDPLRWAIMKGHVDVAQFLIQKGAKLDSKELNDQLLNAVDQNYLEMAKFLLENKADVNFKGTDGATAVHKAFQAGDFEMVKFLMANGATLDQNTKDNQLQLASGNSNLKIVNLLLENGANLESKTDEGDTPLIKAVSNNDKAMVELLLAKGASLETKNAKGNKPLDLAINAGFAEIAPILAGSNGKKSKGNAADLALIVQAIGQFNNKPKMPNFDEVKWAGIKHNFDYVFKGDIYAIKNFISKDELEEKNEFGNTLLVLAITTKKLEVVKALVEKGAVVPNLERYTMTPEIKTYLRSQQISSFDVTNINQLKQNKKP
jgi:ankyrin repeat protein